MRATADAAAPDGVLVRVRVHGDRWAEELPPVPSGFDVSVSFSSEEAAALHGAALQLLGYRVVVVVPRTTAGDPQADFLVTRRLLSSRPRWTRALVERAEATYDLAFGPVVHLVADVLRAHAPAHRPAR